MIDPDDTMDREEADECRKMHDIVKRHNLHDCFRWIVAQARPWGGGGRLRVHDGGRRPWMWPR